MTTHMTHEDRWLAVAQVANLWADPEGPTAADMERLRQMYFDLADRILTILRRTPRAEEEVWCAFLDALGGFEEAVANLWADPEGPTAADMERLRQSRQRVIECARVLAALRRTRRRDKKQRRKQREEQ